MTALANVSSPGAGGSGLTDAELRATPVPVSGTVSVTEPVSIDDNGASLTVDGAVAVSNFPASQAVTGTFWQATQPVSGTFWQATQPVSGTFWQATQPVSGTVTANQGGTWTVQPGNTANTTPWLVKKVRAATPAQTSPSVTSASTSVLASNANRLGATIFNEGAAICYLKLGGTASTTSYSCQIASGGYYEVPFEYTGAIDGITSTGTSQLRVTELTA